MLHFNCSSEIWFILAEDMEKNILSRQVKREGVDWNLGLISTGGNLSSLAIIVCWLFNFLEMHLLFTVFPSYLRQGSANIQDKVSSLCVLFKKDMICCEEN